MLKVKATLFDKLTTRVCIVLVSKVYYAWLNHLAQSMQSRWLLLNELYSKEFKINILVVLL